MAEDFGSYLKSERELRGVPLEEVAATTKIHIRFLIALENNQFDELPGEVFVKGYIRSFAKVIGFDENEMLSAYGSSKRKLSPITENESVPTKNKTAIDKNIIGGLGLAILVLAGVGWGINVLINKTNESAKKSTPVILKSDQKEAEEFLPKNFPVPVSLSIVLFG